jgi:hypothetical protein
LGSRSSDLLVILRLQIAKEKADIDILCDEMGTMNNTSKPASKNKIHIMVKESFK